jgi:hypothetical protein
VSGGPYCKGKYISETILHHVHVGLRFEEDLERTEENLLEVKIRSGLDVQICYANALFTHHIESYFSHSTHTN